MDVPDKLTFDNDGAGMDVRLNPALLAHRQVFLVMGDCALDMALNDQVLIGRQLSLDNQGRADH